MSAAFDSSFAWRHAPQHGDTPSARRHVPQYRDTPLRRTHRPHSPETFSTNILLQIYPESLLTYSNLCAKINQKNNKSLRQDIKERRQICWTDIQHLLLSMCSKHIHTNRNPGANACGYYITWFFVLQAMFSINWILLWLSGFEPFC